VALRRQRQMCIRDRGNTHKNKKDYQSILHAANLIFS
jgi:hypothetical protein